MSMSYKERCSRGAPCIFCGDIGYDMRVIYPETEDIVHWCHKAKVQKGDVISAGGKDYICISADHETREATMGTFCLFKEYLSKEEWKAKQERINPNWSGKGSNNSFQPRPREISFDAPASDRILPGEEKPLSNKELDRRYRFMLSLMVLENKHKTALLNEWASPVHNVSHLLKDFPIRSLPPADKVRWKNKERLNNPTRRAIIEKMFHEFGSLKGIPGLYRRGGSYWEEKEEWERWTFAFQNEGLIFPCFDGEGNLYRIRIKDDYPDLEVKEKDGVSFMGKYGYFHRFYDKEGLMKCQFVPTVGEPFDCPLKDAFGKARGKYKNFSSVVEVRKGDQIVNMLEGGCRSGSPYSLYKLPNQSMGIVIATEGEKKAMVASAVRGVPCISIPGVSSFNVIYREEEDGTSLFDKMVKAGCKVVILAYDADKENNETVLKAEKKFAESLKAHGMMVMSGSWSKDYDKGLDDILLLGLEMIVKPF